jgi:NAD(P)-dependent dehydrogenase (short-subunit alcohol dehydrogenase family)
MLTVDLAQELCRRTIRGNSANPGSTKSDLNGITETQPVEVGAIAATRLALRMTMAQQGSPSQRTLPFPGRRGPVFGLMKVFS